MIKYSTYQASNVLRCSFYSFFECKDDDIGRALNNLPLRIHFLADCTFEAFWHDLN